MLTALNARGVNTIWFGVVGLVESGSMLSSAFTRGSRGGCKIARRGQTHPHGHHLLRIVGFFVCECVWESVCVVGGWLSPSSALLCSALVSCRVLFRVCFAASYTLWGSITVVLHCRHRAWVGRNCWASAGGMRIGLGQFWCVPSGIVEHLCMLNGIGLLEFAAQISVVWMRTPCWLSFRKNYLVFGGRLCLV